jgi:hypothetical protein
LSVKERQKLERERGSSQKPEAGEKKRKKGEERIALPVQELFEGRKLPGPGCCLHKS